MATVKSSITSILMLSVLLSTSGLLQTLEENNDEIFQEYLLNATKNFTSWLQEKRLDPTRPTTDPLIVESSPSHKVILKCEIRDQQMTGYSGSLSQNWDAVSLFQEHTFTIERNNSYPYKFEGNFNCTGRISALEEEFPFSGAGKFIINASYTEEFAVYTNLGITNDHKLNFSLSYIDYGLYPTINFKYHAVTWNDSRIINNNYSNEVRDEFTNVYTTFLRNPEKLDVRYLHPAMPLLTDYISRFTQDLDLTTILNKDSLPSPYLPSPKPATATPVPSTIKMTEASAETTTDLESAAAKTTLVTYLFIFGAVVLTI